MSGIGFAVIAIVSAWYAVDRPSLINVACEAGMPNYSRPVQVPAEDLGCIALSEEIQITGISTGPWNIKSDDFSPYSDDNFDELLGGYSGELVCLDSACEEALSLRSKLDTSECSHAVGPWVKVVLSGWVTVQKVSIGHSGMINRRFFVRKVVAVAPPPQTVVDIRDAALIKAELCPKS